MQDILSYVIKNIVTTPADVKIEEVIDETGTTTYLVTVNPSDVGRIIGKEGKVIKAIRTIMRVIAIQKGVHVRVSVVSESEDNQNSTPVEEQVAVETEDSLNVEV
ncbi:MAG: hypothetical protein DPW11_00095 [bacterium]|nr:KH domain-containing protein [Candidatus Microgenomates bacterium CPR3]MCQ3944170.1 hypothetical protein [bacterium]RIK51422.1 MAG: hypothetical protein DCC61_02665 [Candidatus Microgenomates bacterium]